MFIVSKSGWGLESKLVILPKQPNITEKKSGYYFNLFPFFTGTNTSLEI